MLIESLIRRKDGTTVTLGSNPTRVYKFAPVPPDPRHVATVTNEDDIQTFLAIKEGYRIAKGSTAAAATTQTASTASGAAGGSAANPTPPVLRVLQQGGKTGKWFVVDQTGKAVSEGFTSKSDADAALAATEKSDGE